MILLNIIWKFKCKIYQFMVCPIYFYNSIDALLSWSICPNMINFGNQTDGCENAVSNKRMDVKMQ